MWCLLENQWLLAAFCNSCVWVLQLSWVPKLNFNIIKSLWGRNQMCRACWETNELTGPEGFLSRTVGSFATQEKPRTHLQKTIHRKGNQWYVIIWTEYWKKISFYYFSCGIYELWILGFLFLLKNFKNDKDFCRNRKKCLKRYPCKHVRAPSEACQAE